MGQQDDHYSLAVLTPAIQAQLAATGTEYEAVRFDRVTSVIGKTLGKDGALMGWAYAIGLDAALQLANSGLDVSDWDKDKVKAWAKDAGLTPWRKRDAAASRGTDAHYVAELAATGRWDEARAYVETVPEEVRGYAQSALAFVTDYANSVTAGNAAPIEGVERVLYSLEHRFAGTVDLVVGKRGEFLQPWDFKTSKGVYESHRVQLGAYAIALEEMFQTPVTGGKVILLRETGEYEVHDAQPLPAAFLGLLQVYRALKAQKEESHE